MGAIPQAGTPAAFASTQEEARDLRDQRDKELQTLRARAALAGFALHVLVGGNGKAAFMVARWNLSRTLANAAAVTEFLDRVGAPHA